MILVSSQLSEQEVQLPRWSSLVSGRGHRTLAQGCGWHPGVGTNSWPFLGETAGAQEGAQGKLLALSVLTSPRRHCPQ